MIDGVPQYTATTHLFEINMVKAMMIISNAPLMKKFKYLFPARLEIFNASPK
jgi:hypothetical protein